ncbi:DEAD/DEAH box helicase [Balneolaceae bacterium ANBcel3]|nr:DEAD/DEAH box helicase [Balneolaceae bacterium ANBcel3]
MSFEEFNLNEEVLNGLRDMGFDKPTPVQQKCVPLILEGRDVLASAQTGTGKTAAFAIPVLEKLSEKKKKKQEGIRALVLTPTRELAGQVDEAFFAIGYHTGLTTAKVYGGDDWSRQERALTRGVNIIVATPGRLLDHMKIHDVDFSNLDYLILDEADRMLDMGFIPDITQIVNQLPKNRQTLLFSATMPPKIEQLAQKMMRNPERITLAASNKAAEGVRQGMYYVEERDKLSLVLHLYEKENWSSAIIFMSTKRAVDKLSRELTRKGASVTSIHGDRTQAEREKALASFRKGEYRIIVATDVMSRGIDIDGVSHVINFSVPHDVEDYVHRIGRTARAEATGDAITLVSGQDRRYMENIIRAMDSRIIKHEVPEKERSSRRDSSKKDEKEKTSSPPTQKKDKEPQKSEGDSNEKEAKKPQGGRRPKKPVRGRRPKKDAAPKGKEGEQTSTKPGPDKKESASDNAPPKPKRRGRPPSKRKPQDTKSDEKAPSRKGAAPKRRPTQKRRRPGQGKHSKTSPADRKRKELFENVTSPDMEKVNRSVGKKEGVWSKIKGIFGTK